MQSCVLQCNYRGWRSLLTSSTPPLPRWISRETLACLTSCKNMVKMLFWMLLRLMLFPQVKCVSLGHLASLGWQNDLPRALHQTPWSGTRGLNCHEELWQGVTQPLQTKSKTDLFRNSEIFACGRSTHQDIVNAHFKGIWLRRRIQRCCWIPWYQPGRMQH